MKRTSVDSENGSYNDNRNEKKKKQRCVDRPLSLLQLCMRQAALHLPRHAHKLQLLPTDLSITLLHDFLRQKRTSFTELKTLCENSSWSSSQALSLCGVQRLNSRGVQQLSLLPHLVQLDFRGCQWLVNLNFLSALNCLECLNLRDCWFLKAEDLLHIRELPQLQCLDVENVSAMTDDAAHTISELTNLRALNVSGTCVGDGLVEFLTYGSRLHSWASQQEETTVEDLKLVTETGQYRVQTLMSQYPVSNLTYLRLQRTHITHAAIAHLLAIPDLLLLDVRLTNVTGRSLFSLKAKHKLIALPNNARVAARTNAMLAGVLEGECGCRAMTRHCKPPSNPDKTPDEFMELWQQAYVQLLQEASNGTSCSTTDDMKEAGIWDSTFQGKAGV